MAEKRKPAPRKSSKADSALDAAQRAIAEQEAKVRAQMQRYERLIQEAPKLAKERERLRREQFVNRASRTEHRAVSRAVLPDRKLELNAGAPARERRLRAERNRGRATFFFLLMLLAAAMMWVYYTVLHAQ